MAEKKVLLASHGELALGLKKTVEFFLGRKDSILAVYAYLDASDDYLNVIQKFIEESKEGEAVIFTDILGGSVNQQVLIKVKESQKKIPVITSMNLPVVLSAAMEPNELTEERVAELCSECSPQMVALHTEREEAGDLDAFLE